MKIAVLTSNQIRHKFVANSLIPFVDDMLVVSESKPHDSNSVNNSDSLIQKHFRQRFETEKNFFPNNDFFESKTIPLLHKELNLEYTCETIKNFAPDLVIVFGSSIIKEEFFSYIPSTPIINLHLGLSPYYRGSGTNFWPLVNNELEFLGSTILHLDSGIDTGDIICHVVADLSKDDNVHTIGCKIIKESSDCLKQIIKMISKGKELNRVKQWKVNEKYYTTRDFTKEVLLKYLTNLDNGMVEKFIQNPKVAPKLIKLE